MHFFAQSKKIPTENKCFKIIVQNRGESVILFLGVGVYFFRALYMYDPDGCMETYISLGLV